jgi:hypothetical protein
MAVLGSVIGWPSNEGHMFYSDLTTKDSNVFMTVYTGKERFPMRVYLDTNITNTLLFSESCFDDNFLFDVDCVLERRFDFYNSKSFLADQKLNHTHLH